MTSRQFKLTPEQIALSEQRKQRKKQAERPVPGLVDSVKGRILFRKWIALPHPVDLESRQRVKIMTFNLLAQCLVRRVLFPTSDCLKVEQRQHIIFNEIVSSNADILCLQEVDRLEKLVPVLEQYGYHHIYAAGPSKKHGCLIACKKEKYAFQSSKSFCYDDQEVGEGSEARRGISFRTKNIASLVALKPLIDNGTGLIVATTHLFWHPRYTYERARQAAILLRETGKFRDQVSSDWICMIAGDFNFTPNDPAYSLLVGDPILPAQEELLQISRVVHASIDPNVGTETATEAAAEEDEGEEKDPDRIITKARLATPEDGLLTTSELIKMVAPYGPLRSSYNEAQEASKVLQPVPTYADRVAIEPTRFGRFEPQWTCYTHYWKTVLDYIFVLDPSSKSSQTLGFLQTPATEELEPGLPRKNVGGSDHVSLVAEICW